MLKFIDLLNSERKEAITEYIGKEDQLSSFEYSIDDKSDHYVF